MFAAVDLGSNSFRLHVGYHDGESIRVVRTARDPVRLGIGLDANGNLTEAAMKRALQCLNDFRAILAEYPLDAVRVVATNTLRIAKNAREFLPAAEAAIGYPIEIISGEEEGRLIYMGVATTISGENEERLVVDIGGGSTEIILGCGPHIRHVESFSIGTVPQVTSYFPDGEIKAAAFEAAIFSARSYFEDAASAYAPSSWTRAYGTSGTIRAISDAIVKNSIGDGKMSFDSLCAFRAVLVKAGHIDRIRLQGIKQERLPAMLGGLSVLLAVMEELSVTHLTAVNAGLRVGVLSDLQLRASKHDRREDAVQDFGRRFQVDFNRGSQVADAAMYLYARLKPETERYSRYLYWAGLVHEAGMLVSHTGYHKHGAYLIENADLSGFTNREQRILSTLVLGQKGNLKKMGDDLLEPDLAKAVLALRMAILLMHSRTCAEVGALRLKMKNKSRVEFEVPGDWFSQHPTLQYWVQKERGWWQEIGVEFIV